MSVWEVKWRKAIDEDKIIFYDYISYKEAAGWWRGFINSDWQRPSEVKKARYDSKFIKELRCKFFMGVPLEDVVRYSWANGLCHSAVLALSLNYDKFKIYTCNLKNYKDHYNEKIENSLYGHQSINEYEHSFLVINKDGIDTVIDTTFGIITDLKTYDEVMNLRNIRIITDEDLKDNEIYKFLKENDKKVAPYPIFNTLGTSLNLNDEYDNITKKYTQMCKEYKNQNDLHMQDFFNRCIYRTSNYTLLDQWVWDSYHKDFINNRNYPNKNMYSLEDDVYDNFLYSEDKDTTELNIKMQLMQIKKLEEKTDIIKYIDSDKQSSKNKGIRSFFKERLAFNKHK